MRPIQLFSEFPAQVSGSTFLEKMGPLGDSGVRWGHFLSHTKPIDALYDQVCGGGALERSCARIAANGGAMYFDGWWGGREMEDGTGRLISSDEEFAAFERCLAAHVSILRDKYGIDRFMGYWDCEADDAKASAAVARRLLFESGVFKRGEITFAAWFVVDADTKLGMPRPFQTQELVRTPGVVDGFTSLVNGYIDYTSTENAADGVDRTIDTVRRIHESSGLPILHVHGGTHAIRNFDDPKPGTGIAMTDGVREQYRRQFDEYCEIVGENAAAIIFAIGGRGSFPAFVTKFGMPMIGGANVQPDNWDPSWVNNDYAVQAEDESAAVCAARGV